MSTPTDESARDEVLLSAEEVSFAYHPHTPVLDRVTMSARRGELLGILGVNGAGKSTLLYCLDRVLHPSHGTVRVAGHDITAMSRTDLARRVALVAQRTSVSQLSVFDFVLLGRRPYMGVVPGGDDLAVVSRSLARFGLSDYALRYVNELSGGEFQKVVLARALSQQPEVLLLDEPTNNLDPFNQMEVMRSVRSVIEEADIAAVTVMHDLNLALRFCDRLLFLAGGRVYAQVPTGEVDAALIRDVYRLDVEVIEHRGNRIVVAC